MAALCKHTVALASGPAISIGLGLFEHWKSTSLPFHYFALLFVSGVIPAGYFAWCDQRRAVEELESRSVDNTPIVILDVDYNDDREDKLRLVARNHGPVVAVGVSIRSLVVDAKIVSPATQLERDVVLTGEFEELYLLPPETSHVFSFYCEGSGPLWGRLLHHYLAYLYDYAESLHDETSGLRMTAEFNLATAKIPLTVAYRDLAGNLFETHHRLKWRSSQEPSLEFVELVRGRSTPPSRTPVVLESEIAAELERLGSSSDAGDLTE